MSLLGGTGDFFRLMLSPKKPKTIWVPIFCNQLNSHCKFHQDWSIHIKVIKHFVKHGYPDVQSHRQAPYHEGWLQTHTIFYTIQPLLMNGYLEPTNHFPLLAYLEQTGQKSSQNNELSEISCKSTYNMLMMANWTNLCWTSRWMTLLSMLSDRLDADWRQGGILW